MLLGLERLRWRAWLPKLRHWQGQPVCCQAQPKARA
jgi:hypothetical protein